MPTESWGIKDESEDYLDNAPYSFSFTTGTNVLPEPPAEKPPAPDNHGTAYRIPLYGIQKFKPLEIMKWPKK